MITKIGGDAYWRKKKRDLQDEKDRKREVKNYEKRKERKRKENLQKRKIRKKMGWVRYFCCAWERKQYEILFPVEEDEDQEAASAAKLAEERAKAREKAKHLADLAVKNPETEAWKVYQVRKNKLAIAKQSSKPKRIRTKEDEREERREKRRRKKRPEPRR